MNRSLALRAGAGQALLVLLVSLALGTMLDREFFVSWGWLAGPGAWFACALAVGAALRLSLPWVLAGAALSGLPSLAAVLSGVHWAGVPVAVVTFALWCGWLARRGRAAARRDEVPPGGIEPPLPA